MSSTDQKSSSSKSSSSCPAYYPIKELTTWTSRWTVQARVIEKSAINEFKRDGQAMKIGHVQIMDKQGDSIKAVFFGEAATKWLPKLQEKSVYTFRNGRIQVANKRFSTLPHPYEIYFEKDAEIAESSIENQQQNETAVIPMHRKANITKLRDVRNSARSTPFIVDLCVAVTWLSPNSDTVTRQDGGEVQRRNATVCDDSGFEIQFTLWGDFANNEKLIEAYDKKSAEEPMIVIIHNVQVREFRGRSATTVRSSHFIINPTDDEAANELRKWMQEVGDKTEFCSITESNSQLSQESADGRPTPQQCTLSEAFEKLQDLPLLGAQDAGETITVVAQPMKLLYAARTGEVTLLFQACNRCNRKCNSSDGVYNCDSCGTVVSNPVERFLFGASLVDTTGSNFMARCFHETGQRMLGHSAADVRKWIPPKSTMSEMANEAKRLLDYEALWRPFRFRLRMKKDLYGGEEKKNVTVIGAERLNFAADARRMLAEIARQLPNYSPLQQAKKRPQSEASSSATITKRKSGTNGENDEEEMEEITQRTKRAKLSRTEEEQNKENENEKKKENENENESCVTKDVAAAETKED